MSWDNLGPKMSCKKPFFVDKILLQLHYYRKIIYEEMNTVVGTPELKQTA